MIVESCISPVKGCVQASGRLGSGQTRSEGPAAPVRGAVEPQS